MNHYIDNMNYHNDARVCGPAEAPILYMDDGSEKELATHWDVCPVCDGEGKHVNPSIDAGGLTAEDFAEDPGFLHNYMSGMYDIKCNMCAGRTTVRAVDWDALSEADAKAYREQLDEAHYEDMERRAEMRMGA